MDTLTQINIKYFLFSLFLLFATGKIDAQNKKEKFVLVLDAGHGGKDPGTHGVVQDEKQIALDITLKVGRLIEDYYKNDIKVIYTRKDDRFIELHERANIANRNDADLFVSIHCNAAHPSANGTETFVLGTESHRSDVNFNVVKRENSVILLEDEHQKKYEGFDPKSPESIIGLTLMQNSHLENSLLFARKVEENFIKRDKRLSRGVKQQGFLVLVRTATPSVLIETGFISNPEEGRYLATNKGQEATAKSIFEAFKYYKTEWDIRNGNPVTKNNRRKKNITKPESKPEKPIDGKTFKIQFLTSKRRFRLSSPQLKGLNPVEIIKSGDLYKYYYGNTSFESRRDYYLDRAKRAGFPDAFVVDFVTEKSNTDKNNSHTKVNKNTGFRIQILTSSRNYNKNALQFKGLKSVDKIGSDGLYRYYYGWYNTEEEAKKHLTEVQSRGFPDAFIVRFINGKKI